MCPRQREAVHAGWRGFSTAWSRGRGTGATKNPALRSGGEKETPAHIDDRGTGQLRPRLPLPLLEGCRRMTKAVDLAHRTWHPNGPRRITVAGQRRNRTGLPLATPTEVRVSLSWVFSCRRSYRI